ncbi:MAG: PilW family protein [Gammaproteobacteria bacterium]|jgi:type IV pilus assembly protein PilW|nr:PilW family protein [Gammaproteobacteria bacterium]MDP6616018.1 PilW family protein [Gammaproteobacteria bacterium]MDP6695144.1 PilW family protein [Gammaproteobacteria bacterium]
MKAAAGFTLVELMVALLLGSIIIAGALSLFNSVRAAYTSAQLMASLQERGAFALTALEDDLRLAGFWGLHSDAGLINIPSGIRVHCAGRNISAWALQLADPVDATDNGALLPCPPADRFVPGTDTLIVRHASAETADDPDRIRLHTSETTGNIFRAGAPPDISGANTFELQISAWHLDAASSESGLPALRRFTLTNNGLMQNQEIMPGVEDFQVLLGIDRDGDLQIDSFVNGDDRDGAPVLAVSIWLLIRSERSEPGHHDNGPWYSIDTDARNPLRPDDSYRRASFMRTVYLRNRPPA